MADLTPSSRAVRLLWWLLLLTPLLALLAAIDSQSALSADEALGAAFLVTPPLLLAVVVATVVLVRTWLSRALTARHKRLLAALGLSPIPTFFLVSYDIAFAGWHSPDPRFGTFGATVLTAIWVGLVVWARKGLGHGAPFWRRPELTAWSPPVRALWWLCGLIPPVVLAAVLYDALEEPRPSDRAFDAVLFPTCVGLVVAVALGVVVLLLTPFSRALPPRQKPVLAALGLSPVALCVVTFLVAASPDLSGGATRPAALAGSAVLTALWVALALRTRKALRREEPDARVEAPAPTSR